MSEGDKVLEVSEDHVISMSKVLTDVGHSDTTMGRKFLYAALSLHNPWCMDTRLGIDDSIRWVKTNDPDYKDMSQSDLEKNEELIAIVAIERFFDLHPERCSFNIEYKSFVDVWCKKKKKKSDSAEITTVNYKNYSAAVRGACSSAVKMTYARTHRRVVGNKTTKISDYMPVFSKLSVSGITSIKIKLNSSFMPYVVMLNELFKNSGYVAFPVKYLKNKNTLAGMMMSLLVLRYFYSGNGDEQVHKFDVETLRNLLGCDDKYPTFKEFKRSVVDKGIRDINADKNSGFSVELLDTIKEGRSVTHIKFLFISKELNAKRKLPENQKQALVGQRKAELKKSNVFTPPENASVNSKNTPDFNPLKDLKSILNMKQ